MHLDQRVHPPMPRGVLQLGGLRVLDARHDDQDAVGAPGARLGHLVGIVEEILAQDRQRGRRAGRAQVGRRALEGGVSVSTDRQVAPPAS
jgi:hypothetical protein